MRPLDTIDAELKAARLRVIELQQERNDARKAQIDTIVREFDAGRSFDDLARDHGQTRSAIQGLLLRSGRTLTSRIAIKARAHEAAQVTA